MTMQGQELKQTQTQKLSPIQMLTIKLLELPLQELRQRVRSEMEENPVLDEKLPSDDNGDVSLDELAREDETPSYRYSVRNWGRDSRPEYNTFSVRESFSQTLEDQLGCHEMSDREHEIALFIIGSLDDDGYLRRDTESIVDDLAFRTGIETDSEELLRVLKIVQQLEPAGVGARDLRECLLLQLGTLAPSQEVKDAQRILSDCYQDFTQRHFERIMDRLDIDEERFKAAKARIVRLNPSPGGKNEDPYNDEAQQIVPDFVLEEDENGKLTFSMPRFNVPELRVNRKYAQMLEEASGSSERARDETVIFVKKKIDSAKWLIEALKQRQNTLQRTMQAILDYQYEFFETGDDASLKPMVLRNIADITGFDISTISRVVNSKYIETHFGIYKLKYFFSEGMENTSGDEISTKELKQALRQCVDAEDKSKPLTDEQLVAEMAKKGYKLARRTIAKYRSQLNIPHARWRKEL